MQTLYITHPACSLHEMGPGHPERPQRLAAIDEALKQAGLFNELRSVQSRMASDADLLRVHTAAYLDLIRQSAPVAAYAELDPDTLMNSHTLEAARAAAGAGLVAVDQIMQQQALRAFCAVRPPGHHACSDRAMGFCFFNNVAVAAAYALEKYGLDRIAVIDFDVHHGNGTEEIFLDNKSILMCSFFQYPLFPGVRAINNGQNMLNIALPPHASGSEARQVVEQVWLPRLNAFRPQLVLISAGFDAHKADCLAQLELLESDFAWITEKLVDLADRTAQGRIISFLEGGYNLAALGCSVAAHLRSLVK